jgi:pilus assembly protein CpaC
MPGRAVGVQTIEGGILLTGAVPTATEADDILRLASRYIGEKEQIVNQLKVTAPNQVNLRIRIAEVNKNLLRSLGINWEAVASIGDFAFGLLTAFPVPILSGLAGATGFGSVDSDNLDLTATIDLLSQEGLVSLLAEPNLTAVSGETATFLAGGEFPIPVSQDEDTITVEFKPFGVSLSFTPTVLSSNRISMRVKPEVSTLSTQGQVTVGDIVLPGLAVRRAETTVELASGQTFAIAGLVQSNNIITANDVPGLSEIPVLGELFKSDRFQRDETELVILATPYIVQPIGNPNAPSVPNDLTTGAEGSQRLAVNALSSGGFTGQAGFVIE